MAVDLLLGLQWGDEGKGKIVVVVKNKTILNNLVENIKKINGIDKVTRV